MFDDVPFWRAGWIQSLRNPMDWTVGGRLASFDAEDVARVVLEARREAYGALGDDVVAGMHDSEGGYVNHFASLIESSPVALAARRAGRIFGFGLTTPTGRRKELQVSHLYVADTYRSFGVGALLMSTIAARSGWAGYKRLTLNVFEHSPAVAFYERLGFRQTGTIDDPYYASMGHGRVMTAKISDVLAATADLR